MADRRATAARASADGLRRSATSFLTPLLSAHDLTVGIAGATFCRDLQLDVQPGDCLAILGRNGAGKSTLLSVLAGLRPPLAGKVRLNGADYHQLGARASARLRGWLPQTRNDAFAATVIETALIGRHPHLGRWEWESVKDAEIARQALAAVGLTELAMRDVQTLSGGERQRLAIATLLCQDPHLLLLDEPLAHLDLNHQIAILELLATRSREQRVACVVVLHEPGLAARFCTRALLLFGDGESQQGSCDELITSEALSRLYGYPLKEVGDGPNRWFMPV
ncbi:MAG TPA: ABC transporter ATP-binding protein [Accumulibacter sp.]|nr:ABC transporter ATP-binding protein [Accumulibacter sp.]HMW17433.1 ABC transporter ATP-binding protein [Accumulibacter sp.]HMX22047.1 ABC transporter ATP-binding protein [Accumulibacter sp.]HMY06761.1 ABC transporter ATP-binding protein [Accumulibacter sp.]HNC17971.1 ABC transporter ATP-binding protein [Accumulibacter sp.]